jgi:signal transduction histidine kinase
LEGSLDSETRENLAKSHSASKSLIYVINDLLDLTKTEEGMDLMTADLIDFEQTFAEATDAFRGDATRKGIEYLVITHPGVPKQVRADQRKLRQAITNVVANAIHHTTKGSVTVEAYVVSRGIADALVEVAVKDTGVGMSSKKMEALFRALEQVQSDDVLSSPGGGLGLFQSKESPPLHEENALGLGLAIVARILRNMDGHLRVKSEEGKGSRFILQFPFEVPEDGSSSE